jgi:hypothetical protein
MGFLIRQRIYGAGWLVVTISDIHHMWMVLHDAYLTSEASGLKHG